MGNKHSFEKERHERPHHEWHMALDNAGMAMCTAALAALVAAAVHDAFEEAQKASLLCHSQKCPHDGCDIPQRKKIKEIKTQGTNT